MAVSRSYGTDSTVFSHFFAPFFIPSFSSVERRRTMNILIPFEWCLTVSNNHNKNIKRNMFRRNNMQCKLWRSFAVGVHYSSKIKKNVRKKEKGISSGWFEVMLMYLNWEFRDREADDTVMYRWPKSSIWWEGGTERGDGERRGVRSWCDAYLPSRKYIIFMWLSHFVLLY